MATPNVNHLKLLTYFLLLTYYGIKYELKKIYSDFITCLPWIQALSKFLTRTRCPRPLHVQGGFELSCRVAHV